MLPITQDHVQLFLHILAAGVWVGGQLTVVGLLPVVRDLGGDTTRAVAQRFARVAWPAYAVLVATGVWSLTEVRLLDRTAEYQVTLTAKVALVVLSGVGAALHARATSKAAVAGWGALALFAGVGALLLGVVLRG